MSMKDRVRRRSTCRPHPKIKFTKEEDERLRQIVTHFGDQDWAVIADQMPGRNQRQCRERWLNYLSPHVNKEPFTIEEDQLLIEKHKEFGSRWVRIAKYFSGRSDTSIKNRWMILQRKILMEEEESFARTCDDHASPRVEPIFENATSKNTPTSTSPIQIPEKQSKRKVPIRTDLSKKVSNDTSFPPNPTQVLQPQMMYPQFPYFIPHATMIPNPYQMAVPYKPYSFISQVFPSQTENSVINNTITRNVEPEEHKSEQLVSQPIQLDSDLMAGNEEVDFWNEIFSTSDIQTAIDSPNWY